MTPARMTRKEISEVMAMRFHLSSDAAMDFCDVGELFRLLETTRAYSEPDESVCYAPGVTFHRTLHGWVATAQWHPIGAGDACPIPPTQSEREGLSEAMAEAYLLLYENTRGRGWWFSVGFKKRLYGIGSVCAAKDSGHIPELDCEVATSLAPWGMTRRLKVRRTDGGDGIGWDALQEVKNVHLGADACAVEVYPPESEVVNESNIRHLWEIPPEATPSLKR